MPGLQPSGQFSGIRGGNSYSERTIEDGTVALRLDLYTDDYRKKEYLDVHASWADREFNLHHAALAVHHFGIISHTGDNTSKAGCQWNSRLVWSPNI